MNQMVQQLKGLKNEWILIIQRHRRINDAAKFDAKKPALHRIVEELGIKQLASMLTVFPPSSWYLEPYFPRYFAGCDEGVVKDVTAVFEYHMYIPGNSMVVPD